MKYIVTMMCKEIWRAETVIESESDDLEEIKDIAWSKFNDICEQDLEQDNYTKVTEYKELRFG